ncbi:TspO/MBR family protein [Lactiplantibacillus mudanjiangensis]|uniref:Sensory protein [Lactobacillus plantarum JDM1] n=1 Tax=Lactiplantibacillus mudanjiangensis TaxID=1296538 RepID=A0A660DYR2_9LACO|nr:TspO/MBR family protein [Lactiplantibacillus mudanjiangensis]VDG25444.1 sensory protein [Lactobacillus plantarum JDM1] [Lactiplantibacillus mudanjiangensis]VDG28528.1 sensory protein [Lactobacillus plantarum JDM1] [Lactiplantibacillus mudanjiangensis]
MDKTYLRVHWWEIVLWLIGVAIIGRLSSLLAGDIRAIYNGFQLPPLAPPDYLFGLVWPVLYALMAIAGALIAHQPRTSAKKRLDYLLFSFQLFLNFCWSIVFFGQNEKWLGLAIILLLDLFVACLIARLYQPARWAAYLLMPYLIWILFATYLTVGVALLN